MPHGFALTVLVEVRCDGCGRDGEVLLKKAQQIDGGIGVLFLNREKLHTVTCGEDEALTYTGLVDEGTYCVSEPAGGDGEPLPDLNGGSGVVDADENEVLI